MPETTPYQPTPEEMQLAENHLSEEQKEASETRESEKKHQLANFIENKLFPPDYLSEEENELAVKSWNEIKVFIEQNLVGDERITAMGILLKSGITHVAYKASLDPKPQWHVSPDLEWIKAKFQEIIPGELLEACMEGHFREDAINLIMQGELDENYAKNRLKSIIVGKATPSAIIETTFDIRQRELPGFFHGFRMSTLEDILSEGIKSSRVLSGGKKSNNESAFPFSVSMSRPYSYRGKADIWRKANAYLETSVVTNLWGATGKSGEGHLTAIIDYDYALPRTYGTYEQYYDSYKTNDDENQSFPGTVPPEKITGIVCDYHVASGYQGRYPEEISDESELPKGEQENTPEMIEQKDKVIEAVRRSGRNIKVYSIDGSLLWPQEVPFWKVTKEFEEKVLKKIRR